MPNSAAAAARAIKRYRVLDIVIILIVVASIIFGIGEGIVSLYCYRIVEGPNNGDQQHTFYVSKYFEKGGCVEFDTWSGSRRKICGDYMIKAPGQ